MIAFRAPAPVIKLLDTAEFVTGKNRTQLILATLEKYLSQVALDLSSEYDDKIKQSRDLLRQAKEQASQTPPATPSERASNRAPSERRGSYTKESKSSLNKPRKLDGKG